jgi:hypothetical protein
VRLSANGRKMRQAQSEEARTRRSHNALGSGSGWQCQVRLMNSPRSVVGGLEDRHNRPGGGRPGLHNASGTCSDMGVDTARCLILGLPGLTWAQYEYQGTARSSRVAQNGTT